ncbi:uncharacterized protein LOC111005626 [Momordica charantia]|uniref:Uncharacterized protein LOC111005626 n=1 Tax=Momordica charantia TaxID=3673 RepID=A0A6J1BXK4_MOMCH|nr:uncharacterized protein LOC111005626 [Momordica charantia]
MKKLCRKSTVHPSPPIISDFLSFLPAAILALTLALSADDKEVLAYLISCSSSGSNATASNFSGARKASRKHGGGKGGVDHAPLFDCDCFMCYRRYWARWDASPNRQLIHEIIDAYEEGLAKTKGTGSGATPRNCKRERRKRNTESAPGESNRSEVKGEGSDSRPLETGRDANGGERNRKKDDGQEEEEEEEEESRGSVRRFVSFVGEKIWSAWGKVINHLIN